MFGWGKQAHLPSAYQTNRQTNALPSSGESQDAYQQTYNDDGQPDNQASLSHEVLAGGASFAAFKAFEDHQRSEGEFILCIVLASS